MIEYFNKINSHETTIKIAAKEKISQTKLVDMLFKKH